MVLKLMLLFMMLVVNVMFIWLFFFFDDFVFDLLFDEFLWFCISGEIDDYFIEVLLMLVWGCWYFLFFKKLFKVIGVCVGSEVCVCFNVVD